MKDISAIILTYNEQVHLERCIRSLKPVVSRIIVVDCHSTDATCDIARSLGADVYEHDWVNYATQLNWAVDNCDIRTQWTLRIDADEYLTPALVDEIDRSIDTLPANVMGISLRRCVIFMNRPLRHGTMYPTRLLRLWRTGKGRCEQRWMDEHIKIAAGRIYAMRHDLVDENLNDLRWWINKHNSYATREALDVLIQRHLSVDDPACVDGILADTTSQARRQRWLKDHFYYRFPPLLRTWLYFLYRYVGRLGFLDGHPGLVFHLMQGLWYRTLVDAKIMEIEQIMHEHKLNLRQALRQYWRITL